LNIVLVQAPTYNPEMEGPIYPLGLSYLAGAVDPRHQVRIVDTNTLAPGREPLFQAVTEAQPDVLGYSIRNIKVGSPGIEEQQVSLEPLHQPLRWLRASFPEVPIVAGGCAFGLYARVLMERFPELDMGVIGEGEVAFPTLLANMDNPGSVQGVIYRQDGRICGEERTAQAPEFPSLSAPDRSAIALEPYERNEYAIGIQTKRGCAMRCLHCADLFLTGGKVRRRDPVAVVDELEQLIRERGLRSFQYVDQVFNVPQTHADDIVQEMLRRGLHLPWTAWFTSRGLDARFLRDARRSGLASVQLSPDSTNDHVLETLRKGESRRDLFNAARAAREAGVPLSVSLFYPNPGESLRSSLDILTFLARTKLRLGSLLWLHGRMVVRTRVYPHTELRDRMIQDGTLNEAHDLVEPVYYEPQPYRSIEAGVERGLKLGYDVRQVLKKMGLARQRT